MENQASVNIETQPTKIIVPFQGILKDEDGGYSVLMNGEKVPVAYFADLKCWFLLKKGTTAHFNIVAPIFLSEDGEWLIANSLQEARTRGTSDGTYEEILLHTIAKIPTDLKAIPNTIHIIWVGDRPLPDYLLKRMITNTLRCPSFRFILHVHPTTRLASRYFKSTPRKFGRIMVSDLRQDIAFQNFLNTDAGAYYQRFLSEPHKNCGAASDLLRYFILHDRGGIYMDADDEVTTQIEPSYQLMAPKQHVLLSMGILFKNMSDPFYNNNNFACHAGCSVMSSLLQEAVSGLQNNEDFLQAPRPWCTAQDRLNTHAMQDYISKILELTGPTLFTRMLMEKDILRPGLEVDLFTAFDTLYATPGRPKIIADSYEEEMLNILDFYFPFSGQNFHIRPGCASTWNMKRPDRTHWFQNNTCF